MAKFYKTEFKIVILSEDPIGDIALEDLNYFVTDGPGCLKQFSETKQTELTGKKAVRELYAAGSDPEFFQLDDKGNDLKY